RGTCVVRRRMVQSVLGLMAFRKTTDSRPQIQDVTPVAAIPGGEFRVRGKGLTGGDRALARFGDTPARVVIGSDSLIIVKVPEGVRRGDLFLGEDNSVGWRCDIGIPIADTLHPVANPAIDS